MVEFGKRHVIGAVAAIHRDNQLIIRTQEFSIKWISLWMAFVYAVSVVLLVKYGDANARATAIPLGLFASAVVVVILYMVNRGARAQGDLAVIDARRRTVSTPELEDGVCAQQVYELVEVVGAPAVRQESNWFRQVLLIVAERGGYRAYALHHEVQNELANKGLAAHVAQLLGVKYRKISNLRFQKDCDA